MHIEFRSQTVGDVEVFHRAAGPADAPVVLLHGFPTAGHMFRDLIPHLAGRHLAGWWHSTRPRRCCWPPAFPRPWRTGWSQRNAC